MKAIHFGKALLALAFSFLLTACATRPPVAYDYSAFKQSRPQSILVLPPLNDTPEVQASLSVLSHATQPLAESGYYVMPVTLVTETFRENGMTQPAEMHATSVEKLRQIFGADAALYMTIKKYGTVYQVVDSATIVSAEAKLIDLKTGKELWSGSASASSNEGQNNQNSGGLAGLLITAIVKQVISTTTDHSHKIAATATSRLLSAGRPGGILYGPRSPSFGRD